MWAVGCIFAELLKNEPLFPAKSELETLQLMTQVLGAPNERIWPVRKHLMPLVSHMVTRNISRVCCNLDTSDCLLSMLLLCAGLLKAAACSKAQASGSALQLP